MARTVLLYAILAICASAFAQDPVPDFKLKDLALVSPRSGSVVSPRDYILQVTGFFFGEATWSACRAQFEYLKTLQADLRREKLLFNVEILWINSASANDAEYIALATTENSLPLVQDTPTNKVWSGWSAVREDLRILDSSNRLVTVFNLGLHDLANNSNYANARALFVTLANAGDADRDGLPDHWEERFLGGISGQPDEDPDNDGYSNFLEFALGTNPLDAMSHPVLGPTFNSSEQFTLTLNRWAGAGTVFVAEMSTNLTEWSGSSLGLGTATANLYDGTGRAKVTYTLKKGKTMQPSAAVRLKIVPKTPL